MISPIGPFLAMFDAPLEAAVAAGSAALATWVAPVLSASGVLWFMASGIRWHAGDMSVPQNLVPQTARIVCTVLLASSASLLQFWIIGPLYQSISNAIIAALAGSLNPSVTVNISGGLTAAEAAFDTTFNAVMVIVGTVWQHAGITDWQLWGASTVTGITGGVALCGAAILYFLSNFLQALLFMMVALIIGCGMSERLRGVVDRAIGKLLSLVFLQVAAFVTVQMLLVGDQAFLSNIMNASNSSGGSLLAAVQAFFSMHGDAIDAYRGSSGATELANLLAMIVFFLAGLFILYFVPAMAYSLGTGVTTSALPAMIGAQQAARFIGGMSMPSFPSLPSAPPVNGLGVTLNQLQLQGRSPLGSQPPALPPPPASGFNGGGGPRPLPPPSPVGPGGNPFSPRPPSPAAARASRS